MMPRSSASSSSLALETAGLCAPTLRVMTSVPRVGGHHSARRRRARAGLARHGNGGRRSVDPRPVLRGRGARRRFRRRRAPRRNGMAGGRRRSTRALRCVPSHPDDHRCPRRSARVGSAQANGHRFRTLGHRATASEAAWCVTPDMTLEPVRRPVVQFRAAPDEVPDLPMPDEDLGLSATLRNDSLPHGGAAGQAAPPSSWDHRAGRFRATAVRRARPWPEPSCAFTLDISRRVRHEGSPVPLLDGPAAAAGRRRSGAPPLAGNAPILRRPVRRPNWR